MVDVENSAGHRVCVSVCSRERPKMLTRLIESFQRIHVPDHVHATLLVVENDLIPKKEQMVGQLASSSGRPIHYVWEPRLGIPIARNRCIDEARQLRFTHIAFVDDDEWLPENWLTNIWAYYLTQHPLSAIQGPVLSQLPPGVPEHFLEIFQRKIPQTGTRLQMCMTNNVLVPVDFFGAYDLRFDETYPLAGGTDSKLFRQARVKGATLIYCAEAPVYEEVPRQRITHRWLSKRHFRIGLTLGEHTPLEGVWRVFVHVFANLGKSLRAFLKAIFYALISNRRKYWKHWLKACKYVGIALGPLGVRVNAYGTVEGG